MTSQELVVPAVESGSLVRRDVDAAREFAAASIADATKRAYKSDWSQFTSYCNSAGLTALPASPVTVAAYIANMADNRAKMSSIDRALASISAAHRAAGCESPRGHEAVRRTRAGIARTIGVAPQKKTAISPETLRAAVARGDDETLATLRDKALLLIGFAGAFRRSELVTIDYRDLTFSGDGVAVTLRRSKTDQEGKGAIVGIPFGRGETCPVRALKGWLEKSGIKDGAVFRSIDRHGNLGARLTGESVAAVVKKAAKNAGLDPTSYGGHSLRSGLATAAIRAGKSEISVMRQTRHKSVAVFRGYVQRACVFTDNAVSGLLSPA